jgi:hypothetical protein
LAQLANALITRAVYLIFQHRRQEGEGVLRHALRVAEQYDLPVIVLRARYNLAALSLEADRFHEAVQEVEMALALARERGDRAHERRLLGQSIYPLHVLGRWSEASTVGSELLAGPRDADTVFAAAVLVSLAAARGDEPMLQRCRAIAAERRDSSYNDQRVSAEIVLARDALEQDAPADALALMRAAVDETGVSAETIEEAYALSVESVSLLGDQTAIEDLIERVSRRPPAGATPLLRAGRARLQAEFGHRRGDEQAARKYEDEAIHILRSVGARPLLARTLLERARRRPEPEALAEARTIYAELEATKWLERIGQANEVPAPAL